MPEAYITSNCSQRTFLNHFEVVVISVDGATRPFCNNQISSFMRGRDCSLILLMYMCVCVLICMGVGTCV